MSEERCPFCGDPVDRTGRSGRVSFELTWFESETGDHVGEQSTGRAAHRRCLLDAESPHDGERRSDEGQDDAR